MLAVTPGNDQCRLAFLLLTLEMAATKATPEAEFAILDVDLIYKLWIRKECRIDSSFWIEFARASPWE